MATIKTLQYNGLSYFASKIKARFQAMAGDTEAYSVASSAWSALTGADPFKYQATVTATHTIADDTIVELINDSAVSFANYGFAIAVVSGQTVVLYALDKPAAAVSLKINYKEEGYGNY